MSLKKQWINALLSGEYEQGQELLRNKSNEFCCLGVLADICGVQWQEPMDWEHRTAGWSIPEAQLGYGADSMYLGPNLELEDDMYDEDGVKFTVAGKLASMNDDGYSFEEIAKWININLNDDMSYNGSEA